jgi:hypothetical protein
MKFPSILPCRSETGLLLKTSKFLIKKHLWISSDTVTLSCTLINPFHHWLSLPCILLHKSNVTTRLPLKHVITPNMINPAHGTVTLILQNYHFSIFFIFKDCILLRVYNHDYMIYGYHFFWLISFQLDFSMHLIRFDWHTPSTDTWHNYHV